MPTSFLTCCSIVYTKASVDREERLLSIYEGEDWVFLTCLATENDEYCPNGDTFISKHEYFQLCPKIETISNRMYSQNVEKITEDTIKMKSIDFCCILLDNWFKCLTNTFSKSEIRKIFFNVCNSANFFSQNLKVFLQFLSIWIVEYSTDSDWNTIVSSSFLDCVLLDPNKTLIIYIILFHRLRHERKTENALKNSFKGRKMPSIYTRIGSLYLGWDNFDDYLENTASQRFVRAYWRSIFRNMRNKTDCDGSSVFVRYCWKALFTHVQNIQKKLIPSFTWRRLSTIFTTSTKDLLSFIDNDNQINVETNKNYDFIDDCLEYILVNIFTEEKIGGVICIGCDNSILFINTFLPLLLPSLLVTLLTCTQKSVEKKEAETSLDSKILLFLGALTHITRTTTSNSTRGYDDNIEENTFIQAEKSWLKYEQTMGSLQCKSIQSVSSLLDASDAYTLYRKHLDFQLLSHFKNNKLSSCLDCGHALETDKKANNTRGEATWLETLATATVVCIVILTRIVAVIETETNGRKNCKRGKSNVFLKNDLKRSPDSTSTLNYHQDARRHISSPSVKFTLSDCKHGVSPCFSRNTQQKKISGLLEDTPIFIIKPSSPLKRNYDQSICDSPNLSAHELQSLSGYQFLKGDHLRMNEFENQYVLAPLIHHDINTTTSFTVLVSGLARLLRFVLGIEIRSDGKLQEIGYGPIHHVTLEMLAVIDIGFSGIISSKAIKDYHLSGCRYALWMLSCAVGRGSDSEKERVEFGKRNCLFSSFFKNTLLSQLENVFAQAHQCDLTSKCEPGQTDYKTHFLSCFVCRLKNSIEKTEKNFFVQNSANRHNIQQISLQLSHKFSSFEACNDNLFMSWALYYLKAFLSWLNIPDINNKESLCTPLMGNELLPHCFAITLLEKIIYRKNCKLSFNERDTLSILALLSIADASLILTTEQNAESIIKIQKTNPQRIILPVLPDTFSQESTSQQLEKSKKNVLIISIEGGMHYEDTARGLHISGLISCRLRNIILRFIYVELEDTTVLLSEGQPESSLTLILRTILLYVFHSRLKTPLCTLKEREVFSFFEKRKKFLQKTAASRLSVSRCLVHKLGMLFHFRMQRVFSANLDVRMLDNLIRVYTGRQEGLSMDQENDTAIAVQNTNMSNQLVLKQDEKKTVGFLKRRITPRSLNLMSQNRQISINEEERFDVTSMELKWSYVFSVFNALHMCKDIDEYDELLLESVLENEQKCLSRPTSSEVVIEEIVVASLCRTLKFALPQRQGPSVLFKGNIFEQNQEGITHESEKTVLSRMNTINDETGLWKWLIERETLDELWNKILPCGWNDYERFNSILYSRIIIKIFNYITDYYQEITLKLRRNISISNNNDQICVKGLSHFCFSTLAKIMVCTTPQTTGLTVGILCNVFKHLSLASLTCREMKISNNINMMETHCSLRKYFKIKKKKNQLVHYIRYVCSLGRCIMLGFTIIHDLYDQIKNGSTQTSNYIIKNKRLKKFEEILSINKQYLINISSKDILTSKNYSNSLETFYNDYVVKARETYFTKIDDLFSQIKLGYFLVEIITFTNLFVHLVCHTISILMSDWTIISSNKNKLSIGMTYANRCSSKFVQNSTKKAINHSKSIVYREINELVCTLNNINRRGYKTCVEAYKSWRTSINERVIKIVQNGNIFENFLNNSNVKYLMKDLKNEAQHAKTVIYDALTTWQSRELKIRTRLNQFKETITKITPARVKKISTNSFTQNHKAASYPDSWCKNIVDEESVIYHDEKHSPIVGVMYSKNKNECGTSNGDEARMNNFFSEEWKKMREQKPKHETTVVTDYDVLKEHHRFIYDADEFIEGGSESALVTNYHKGLFKEYVICDLSRSNEGKIGMRWRIKEEVLKGKGQHICGCKTCNGTSNLQTLELNFSYKETGQRKQALVKANLCPSCAKLAKNCYEVRQGGTEKLK